MEHEFGVLEVLADINGAEAPLYPVRTPHGWTLAYYEPRPGEVVRVLECVDGWFASAGAACDWWRAGGHDD